jgi:DNA-binding Lrp family transcriptional regulator
VNKTDLLLFYGIFSLFCIGLFRKTGQKTMKQLDLIDKKLLKALQKDCKANAKELSEVLNISKTPIYERIKKLEEEGYIKKYVALIDNKKVGLPLIVFCNVSLAIHDNEHIQQFKSEIQEIEEITECYSIGGIYDFFLKVVVENLEAYDRFVFDKLTKVNGIVKMQSSFVLNEIKYTTELNI